VVCGKSKLRINVRYTIKIIEEELFKVLKEYHTKKCMEIGV
jgi:hypothetical protein